MMQHCKEEGGLWACKKGGARVGAKAFDRTVRSRETGLILYRTLVMHLYCTGCDKPPVTMKNADIYEDQLMPVGI